MDGLLSLREGHESIVVEDLGVTLKIKLLGLKINNGLAITCEGGVHGRSRSEGERELAHASFHLEVLGSTVSAREGNGTRSSCEHSNPHSISHLQSTFQFHDEYVLYCQDTYSIRVSRFANGVTRVGVGCRGACPSVQSILSDFRELAGLKSGGVVAGHIKPS